MQLKCTKVLAIVVHENMETIPLNNERLSLVKTNFLKKY